MNFLIRKSFFKSVPNEKLNFVRENLIYFYREIINNYENLKNIPKGFWIKKLRGVENRFEFRVNNGDRIFFSLEIGREGNEEFTFLLYSSHDHGVKKAKNVNVINTQEFKISQTDFELTEKNLLDESIFKSYNDVITYEIKNDDFFKNHSDNEFYYYYLNDEQYNAIILDTPLFIIGSAGSGKSTITLRKIINLEENNEVYEFKKVGYFTGNSYLKDNLYEQYSYFRDNSKERITDFFTLKEFYKKTLKVDTRKIINFKKFKEFLSFSFPNRKKLKLEDSNIYFEISGIIKGFMGKNGADNWEKIYDSKDISLEEYCDLSKKYSVLSTSLKKEIYKIYVKYEEWKKENMLYDLNDLSLEAMGKVEKFDFILVDEVQDLTETEIYLLSTLVKNKENIIFAGDIHQMVSFNFFSFERLKNFYYKNNMRYNLSSLKKNYRSSKEIVKLANYLTDLRQEYIGNLGLDDYKEGAILDEGSIIFSDIDHDFLKKFKQDVNVAIIVSSDEEKEKLSYEHDIEHRVFTVEEIKGLEYRDIICYNLISDNLWAWEKILSRNVKQDQRYRKYFNLFYVGITRAKKNLVIMEDENKKNELLIKLKDFVNKEEPNKKKIRKEEIIENTTISSKEDWEKEGIKLYKLEKYDEAKHAFEMAGKPTWILEREIELDIENYDYKSAIEKLEKDEIKGKKIHFQNLIIKNIMEENDYIKALKYLEEFNSNYKFFEIKKKISEEINKEIYSKKDINRLIALLMNRNEFSLVGDLYFALKNYELALNFYKKSNNNDGIIKARNEILKIKFKNIPNRDKKIEKLQKLIGVKSINSADKNRRTPLAKAMLEENSFDIAKMLIELSATTNKKISLEKGMGSYMHLSQSSKSPLKWLKFFYELDGDIESETNLKETPLFYAVANHNIECIKFLIDKGCNIEHQNLDGETVIFNIVRDGDVKLFKYFIKKIDNLYLKNKKDKDIEAIFKEYLGEKSIVGMSKEEDKFIRKIKIMESIFRSEKRKRDN